MRRFWQKPVFWIIFFVVLVVLIPLIFYFLKKPLLSNPPFSFISKILSPKITLMCPVPQEFCYKTSVLEIPLRNNKRKYDGLGWNLPKDTAVRAAFDGTFKEQDIYGASPSSRIIILTSNSGQYEARYVFASTQKLTVAEQQKFAQGIPIKTNSTLTVVTDTSPNIDHKEVNIQFYVVDKQNNGKTIQLQPADLGKIVLP